MKTCLGGAVHSGKSVCFYGMLASGARGKATARLKKVLSARLRNLDFSPWATRSQTDFVRKL